MKTITALRAALPALILLIAGACSENNFRPEPVSPLPPPPPPPPTVFSEFVIDQFDATADDTDPVPVDDTDFAFDEGDNPDAFDPLLQP